MSCQRVVPHALAPEDTVLRMHHIHLDPLPRLVVRARQFVAEHAPALPDETRDALLLLTSELVTNAVLHARTPLEVGITVSETSVLVTVHDLDLTLPEQQPYDSREGGWGLGLVTALADQSALEPHEDGGKTAWFRLLRGSVRAVRDDVAARSCAQAVEGGARMTTTGTTPAGEAQPAGRLLLGHDGHGGHGRGTSVPELATGIDGSDQVSMGGLPAGRATVVAGQR